MSSRHPKTFKSVKKRRWMIFKIPILSSCIEYRRKWKPDWCMHYKMFISFAGHIFIIESFVVYSVLYAVYNVSFLIVYFFILFFIKRNWDIFNKSCRKRTCLKALHFNVCDEKCKVKIYLSILDDKSPHKCSNIKCMQ